MSVYMIWLPYDGRLQKVYYTVTCKDLMVCQEEMSIWARAENLASRVNIPRFCSSQTIAMPSEHKSPVHIDQHQQDQLQGQVKECPTCHATLLEPATSLFLSETATVVCLSCRERTAPVISTQDVRQHRIDLDTSYPVRQPPHEPPILQSTRRYQDILPADFDSVVSSSPASSVLESNISYHASSPPSPTYSKKPASLSIQCNIIPQTLPRHQNSFVPHSYESTRYQSTSHSSPDPLADITRIRIRSRGHHCLYPGAAFQGTQKSGRNSYDVNVTIVVCLPLPTIWEPWTNLF